MKILGIDPGLQLCGYAVIESSADTKLIEAGVFRTDANKTLEKRLTQIAHDMRCLLEKFSPEIVAVEDLYSHYAHPKTAILMGHARGVILSTTCEFGTKVKSFAATKIKKAITGNGRATKQQMQRTIQALLRLDAMPEPADVADAISAAMCCDNAEKSIIK